MFGARLFLLLFALVLAFVQASQFVRADLIDVLVVDPEIGAGGQSGFSAGGRYETAYYDLTTNLFGGHSLNLLPAVSSINDVGSAYFDDIGMVILAHKDDSSPSPGTDGGVAKLTQYVQGGGRLLTIGQSMSYDYRNDSVGSRSLSDEIPHRLPAAFYNFPLDEFKTPNVLLTPQSSAIDDIVGGVSYVDSGENAYWYGTNGQTSGEFALSYSAQGGGTYGDGLYGSFGSGRYMMVGSTDFLLGTTASPGKYTTFDNSTFFLNSVDWLSEGAQTSSTPEPSSFVLMSAVGIAAMVRRRRRQRAGRRSDE